MVDFTNDNHRNPENAYIVDYTFNSSSSSDILVAHVIVDTNGVAKASALDKIQKIPVVANDVKNDIRVINRAGEMHDQLVDELMDLIPADNFTTQCLSQPIPTLFTEHSVQRGGNMLGLEKVRENALLWLIIDATETPGQQTIMQDKLEAFSVSLKRFAESEDLNVNWQYLNYVDSVQNPLQSYGRDNIDFIRKIAAKYDASGFFQKKVVSG
ncbi:MAG: hypothetical protein Q9165_007306 [Trypethelium subeluteriae]